MYLFKKNFVDFKVVKNLTEKINMKQKDKTKRKIKLKRNARSKINEKRKGTQTGNSFKNIYI